MVTMATALESVPDADEFELICVVFAMPSAELEVVVAAFVDVSFVTESASVLALIADVVVVGTVFEDGKKEESEIVLVLIGLVI